jgi:hypothetical protein
MGTHRLRVLHVSDLHVVDPAKDRNRQRRGLVLGEAWEANLDAIAGDTLVSWLGQMPLEDARRVARRSQDYAI